MAAAPSSAPPCWPRLAAAARIACADIVLRACDIFDKQPRSSPGARTRWPTAGRCQHPGGVPARQPRAGAAQRHVRPRQSRVHPQCLNNWRHARRAVGFPHHDQETWGHAHRNYDNMAPLARPALQQRPQGDCHSARVGGSAYEAQRKLLGDFELNCSF
jgi:hypothetical protein